MNSAIWLMEPEEHDFPAAADFLDLHYPAEAAAALTQQLREMPTMLKKAKDILRASQLPLLPKENLHVRENLRKVKKGKQLSPVLLVRGDRLIIADGYHRVCAIYYLSEDLEVPCRIAGP